MRPTKEKALIDLLDFVLSGRRYETRNPYSVFEVKQAIVALGGLNGYDLPPRIRRRMRMYSEG